MGYISLSMYTFYSFDEELVIKNPKTMFSITGSRIFLADFVFTTMKQKKQHPVYHSHH